MLFETSARAALQRGVDQLANAVRITLGPKGRNVVIAKAYGFPASTCDGVSVAKGIELDDPFENMGAQLVREVASKTSDIAGDGTTTATVLAQSIVAEGLKDDIAGATPITEGMLFDRGCVLTRSREPTGTSWKAASSTRPRSLRRSCGTPPPSPDCC